MNWEVTLTNGEREDSVIARKVQLGDRVMIIGTDPSFFREELADDVRFFSKSLTTIIYEDSDVELVKVVPTDEAIPDPQVTY